MSEQKKQPEKEKNERRTTTEEQLKQREAGRVDGPSGSGYLGHTPGAGNVGAVEGIGGTGGSSGTGATRVKTNDATNVSGIDTGGDSSRGSAIEDVDRVGSTGSGTASGYQRSTTGSDGMKGRTRGPDGETVSNPDDEGGDVR